ncbi:hypothetical protein SmJEL517_g02892 [Synchytrium microbalum]|uniref:Myosin motor domain-containing protein n=1 Tax=Synchytrium microbalum TaxID=1806994 RepID=A0A507C967_9FUNG|nr:uncharacterized protein SmJEL517_g02892 [Synchytrium microbalum]TPX34536.1 hypothetical protein SmJEL517_g02892 [Synchytrium microbalum]
MADDSTIDIYQKGTQVYFPDEDEGWIEGTTTARTLAGENLKLTFAVPGRKDIVLDTTLTKLAATKYVDLPPLKNPPMLEGLDDLANLSYLHEPAVLNNVKIRYAAEQIYTYSGIVLIAMNPFRPMPIYTPDTMREYSGKRRGELEPHLFAVAEEAYRTMLRESKNQSIIVSGESGAGKTASAKYIMRYFAAVDDLDGTKVMHRSNSSLSGGATEIEEAVLSTNPIMEAFGNAKTTRNDNSSRFGKYIEILFTKPSRNTASPRIMGAKIRTYLLERSRLVFQPSQERNYHVFYQMCAAMPAAERKEFGVTIWQDFHYLKQGAAGVVPGIDDIADFKATQEALSTIGIPIAQQWDIFRVCAALLHIGNIKISAIRDEAFVQDEDPALQQACRLLGIDQSEFKKWIVKKQIILRSEKIVSNVNQVAATTGRDSVAKFLYSTLFDWIVRVTNKCLYKETAVQNTTFIGVLDIYGFEHFKKNSFEQFCINYANEKLQQEFNQHVFKLEQEEYIAEKINWSFIDFNDNQPCITMIEGKLGILDLLDEESRLPSGADGTLITKLHSRFATPEFKDFYEKPRFGQTAFTIKHYATDVTYDIEGFLDKNKDTVSDEHMACLLKTENTFLKDVLEPDPAAVAAVEEVKQSKGTLSRGGAGGVLKKPTLGAIFKASLVQLMATINSTEVHYIRCIKPNMAKAAFQFEPQMVLAQLRACGVLETIRISCAGYPSRWTFQEFADRYYLLIRSSQWDKKAKVLTERIVKARITNEDRFQVGLTKIFFRAGQLAYLENLRSARLREAVVLIQSNMRRYVYHRRYLQMRTAAIVIQVAVRRWRGRRLLQSMREDQAATKIQRTARGYLARSKYNKMRKDVITVQSAWRMHQAIKERKVLYQKLNAVQIQRAKEEKERNAYRRKIVLVQSLWRRKLARREFKKAKEEARSVGKLMEVKYQLDNKVIELSQSVQRKELENKALAEKVALLDAAVTKLRDQLLHSEQKSKAVADSSNEGTQALKVEVTHLRESNTALQKEADKLQAAMKRKEDEVARLTAEMTVHKEEAKKAKEETKKVALSGSGGRGLDEAAEAKYQKEIQALKAQIEVYVAAKYKPDRKADALMSSPTSPGRVMNGEVNGYSPTKEDSMLSLSPNLSPSRGTRSRRHSFAVGEDPGATRDIRTEIAGSDVSGDKLVEDKLVEEEILDSLITNLNLPLPNSQTQASRKEIFFPAHLIGSCMLKMISNDLNVRMTNLMANIMKAIQTLTMKFEDDYVSAFWLSNCYELLCIVKTAQDRETQSRNKAPARGSMLSRRATTLLSETERALDRARHDLEYLLIEIYHGWVKELKKRLNNMIVPAVIENQSLPGYICKQNGGIFARLGYSPATATFSIEQLLNFLSKLSKTMRSYYMEDTMARQLLTELVRVIGVSGFNHILVRKNFLTWKRGVQIQYNVSRLEEWCTSNGISEATLHLQQLLQAAKLLTLNKQSPQDIETIFDVCFLLNPTQIKKLLTLYLAGDYDSPLSPELLKIVTTRAVLNEKSDILLLDLDQAPDFGKPNPRTLDHVDRFIPPWISLPHLQAMLSGGPGASQ